jgi:hypothetical protein
VKRLILLTLLLPLAARAQNAPLQGFCQDGGQTVITQGLASSNTVQASYPQCKVMVYLTGTTTPAPIFNAAGTPISPPLTANTDGSWIFYAAEGVGVDVNLSGGTPIAFPQPFVLVDLMPGGGGSTGSGTINTSANANVLGYYAAPGTTISPLPLGNGLAIVGGALTASGSGTLGLADTATFTSGSGSNGMGNYTAQCSAADCFGFVGGNSPSLEAGVVQPHTSKSFSNGILDLRSNALAQYVSDPGVTFAAGPYFGPSAQTASALALTYTLPSQGNIAGNIQAKDMEILNYASPGYSLGDGCEASLFCVAQTLTISTLSRNATTGIVTLVSALPSEFVNGGPINIAGASPTDLNGSFQVISVTGNTLTYYDPGVAETGSGGTATQYPGGASLWASPREYSKFINYYTSGIHGAGTYIDCDAIGDCFRDYTYIKCDGGFIAPSDEGCYGWAHQLGTDYNALQTIVTVVDAYHIKTNGNGRIPGNEFIWVGNSVSDASSNPLVNVEINNFEGPGQVGNPYPMGTIEVDTANFPVSNAYGVSATMCGVAIQTGEVAPVNYGSGCLMSLTTGTIVPGDANHILTMASPASMNMGVKIATAGSVTTTNISSLTRAAGTYNSVVTATGTFSGLQVGEVLFLNGCSDITICTIATTPLLTATSTSFTYNQTSANAAITTPITTASFSLQPVTMSMHQSAPAGSYFFQGISSGWTVSLLGDEIYDQGATVDGSVYPIGGCYTAHLCAYFSLYASQGFAGIPASLGSAARSKGLSDSTTFGGAMNASLVRTGNVVTVTPYGTAPGAHPVNAAPTYFNFNATAYFGVTCPTDSTFNLPRNYNGFMYVTSTSPVTLQYTQAGSNANSTCPNALLYPQGVGATFNQSAEIYDSVDHTPGVTNPLDGTYSISYQPNFVVNENLYSPPHYSLSAQGQYTVMGLAEPARGSSAISIALNYTSAFDAPAIKVNIAPTGVYTAGHQGSGTPAPVLQVTGNSSAVVDMVNAPTFMGCIVCTGYMAEYESLGNIPAPQLFDIYNILSLKSGYDTLQFNEYTDKMTWNFAGQPLITWDPNTNFNFALTTAFRAVQFDGTVSGGGLATLTQFHSGQPNRPDAGSPVSYDLVIPGNYNPPYNANNLNAIGVTVNGSGGSQEYIYTMGITVPGVGTMFTGQSSVYGSYATLTSSNYNILPCTLLAGAPAGSTAIFYQLLGPGIPNLQMYPVTGTCTASSQVINDTGSYGATVGAVAMSGGASLYSGTHAVIGDVGGYCWTQGDIFGTSTPSTTITGCLRQIAGSDGSFRFDGPTSGDGAGKLSLATLSAHGTGFPIMSGVGTNTDLVGEVTLAGGTGSYSFVSSPALTVRPECYVHDHTTPTAVPTFVVTAGSITITGTGTDVIGYVCIGRN